LLPSMNTITRSFSCNSDDLEDFEGISATT
jgi:hypothetical protein